MVRVFLRATVMDYTRAQIYQLIKFRAPVCLVKCSAKFVHTRIVWIDGYGIYTRANLSDYKVLYCNVSIKFLAYRIVTLGFGSRACSGYVLFVVTLPSLMCWGEFGEM